MDTYSVIELRLHVLLRKWCTLDMGVFDITKSLIVNFDDLRCECEQTGQRYWCWSGKCEQ